VLAVAGTFVLAFRKPDTLGDHSFQDIRMDCSKGTKTYRFGRVGAGVFRRAGDLESCPRLQAPAAKPKVSSTA
jgi:hypothetical protein